MADESGEKAVDPTVRVRQARADDHDGIVAFTEDTWPDRDVSDYLPRVFPEWVESDGPDQRTFVATVDGDPAGVLQGVMLSEYEGWAQGMRVAPDARGLGLAHRLTGAVFDWAAEQGAAVCRNLVFSWNAQGIGTSRGIGFEPVSEFRWAHPEPDAGASVDTDHEITDNADAAWSCWRRSDANRALQGLALAPDESWAVRELTRADLRRLADETAVFAVQEDGSGTRGMAYRVRDYEPGEGDARIAEYGVAAWADVPAARTLFAAISRDAAAVGADRTRVLIPETARAVSDAAYAGVELGEDPDFVLEADLSGR
ncbi:GNAT family N-acetyltransferase [Halorientalis regularis]|uniref:Ribosomal protein S18 acetylase RimI n=1 Tax=Halorientalis regularis TaxID=660518 RepID=A0A1G7HYI5_9EURY|nr:GNAT family N-acetyltransferase [Halorientalis regularis]SDF05581.1 Ribosomal protein S18 acetylase RimI [Halorientalis regularis]